MPYEWLKIVGEPDDAPAAGKWLAELDLEGRTLTLLEDLRVRGRVLPNLSATSISTAGAATYTAAAVGGGLILRDPNGGSRTDVLPGAEALIAALGLAKDGDTGSCYLINAADASETITLGGSPTGVTYGNAGQTLAQNEAALLLIRRTSATTVTVYILGA